MNSTTSALPIDPRRRAASASQITETVSARATKLGWSIWCGLQSYGARRAMREMRLMGIGVGQGIALPTDGKETSGQSASRR